MRPLSILYGKQQIISYRIHYIIGKINVLQISLIQYQQAVSHHLHQFCGLLLWIDVVIPVRISRKLSSVGDITLPLIILCVYLTDILGQDLRGIPVELPAQIAGDVQAFVFLQRIRFRHRLHEIFVIVLSAFFRIGSKISPEEQNTADSIGSCDHRPQLFPFSNRQTDSVGT